MISTEVAAQLLDMGARIGGGPRAIEQLEGAVALHNILERHGVAYLADEVGMGKTYVALGVAALMRHFDPSMRLLVIAPRANIQRKWMKEMSNFVAHNLRFTDLRTRSFGGRPARSMVFCDSLAQLARAVTVDPDRDFFTRLTSFSLPLGKDSDSWRSQRDALRKQLPWIPEDLFSLRDKERFKANYAHALCCALPQFDLVIVDEAHNLKHGLHAGVAARNQVLAGAFGRPFANVDSRLRRQFGPRAGKLLLLSATPVEESYRQLWNQLDVFGRGEEFPELRNDELHEDERKAVTRKFLIRRVTQMHVAGERLTKNLYRREWRGGGVKRHDEHISVSDDRQRLVVALVQKKVAELLGSEKFSPSFQIGMLASFESFLQTAKLRVSEASATNFDDTEQTDTAAEREGVDVHALNRLARDYEARFGREMPHPKMDAVVDCLRRSWCTGRKALIFVRRVASVPELKRKLDHYYDEWLHEKLMKEIPEAVHPVLSAQFDAYRRERDDARLKARYRLDAVDRDGQSAQVTNAQVDDGGLDTFFAWFFRGEGPKHVVSGANIQRRFNSAGSVFATFFEDNPLMTMLAAEPGSVCARLADVLGLEPGELREALRSRAGRFLSGTSKRHPGADRMRAAICVSLELLRDIPGPHQARAASLLHSRYEAFRQERPAKQPPDVVDWLEQGTFFTELVRPEYAELRARLWPPPASALSLDEQVEEQELRALLLGRAARLGHAFLDLYILTIQRIGTMEQKAVEADQEDGSSNVDRIRAYLDLLDRQRTTPLSERDWGAFDELSEISGHFDLLKDLNMRDERGQEFSLDEAPRRLGELLQAQQPVAGMWGAVSSRLVRQFRMPGYPMVLITTDVLQEGEDLHTFCSTIHHYGISWTPSAMEQRVGRIDRVRSQTDRRLRQLDRPPEGEEKLQVHYPYLPDTVELLQVRRVLERTDIFLRLMHEGFGLNDEEGKRISVDSELRRDPAPTPPYLGRLETAFPVPDWALRGTRTALAVAPTTAGEVERRFEAIASRPSPGLEIVWESSRRDGRLLGTVRLRSGRVQPFVLILRSVRAHPLVHCMSPVGLVPLEELEGSIAEILRSHSIRLGAIETLQSSYNLTVEEDVLLGPEPHDVERIAMMLKRVVDAADELERRHLHEKDHPLVAFEANMREEGGGGDA